MPTLNNTTTTAVSVGCGCRKLNLRNIFHPVKPKNKHKRHRSTATTATLSPNDKPYDTTTDQVRRSRTVHGFGWVDGNSLAVEKDSSDPYVDFKESMVQMIMQKEIYGEDDLRDLLNCFLQLNSPCYHAVIVSAFTEVWNTLSG